MPTVQIRANIDPILRRRFFAALALEDIKFTSWLNNQIEDWMVIWLIKQDTSIVKTIMRPINDELP